MYITIQELNAVAEALSITDKIPLRKVKKALRGDTHLTLTAIGTPRSVNGQKLGLQKRFALAKDEIASRFPNK